MAAGSFVEGGRYRALKTALGARPFSGPPAGQVTPRILLAQVGAFVKSKAQAAFRDQKRGNVSWPERGVPNVFGIIADLKAGKRPPARRFESRPAGVDSGFTRKMIAYRVTSDSDVEIGVTSKGAHLLQKGGESESEVIDQTVRDGLYKFLYGSKSKAIKYERRYKNPDSGKVEIYGMNLLRVAAKRALGFLFNKKFFGKRLTMKVPARPFLMVTADDQRDLVRLIGVRVGQAR